MNKPYKWMQLPRNILVGSDTLSTIPEVCKDLGLDAAACLVITGTTTKSIAGSHVHDIMVDEGFDCDISTVDTVDYKTVDEVTACAKAIGAKLLLGVGGGGAIDVAKLAATKADCPFISVPTAASHDGIVSSRASIIHNGETTSVEAKAPLAVIADTKVIATAPYRLLAAGCGDIISNYTAVRDWQLAHRLQNTDYSEYAAALSLMTAEMVLDSADSIRPGLEESVRLVVKALVSSGVAMSIAGSSRPASGSEHKFSHALNTIAPKQALHGEQCGVGTIMMMYLHGGDWQKIKSALETIGAPTTADALGIKDEYIIGALLKSHTIRKERYTILGEGLTKDAAENVARITKVIE